MLLVVVAVGVVLTAIASNTAAASLFIPVIIPFAVMFGIDIRFLVVLGAIAVSLDFVVPIGTPPDTIAYSSGYIHAKDMAKAGGVVLVVSALAAVGLFYLWGLVF